MGLKCAVSAGPREAGRLEEEEERERQKLARSEGVRGNSDL